MRGSALRLAIASSALFAAASAAAVEPTTHECIVANSSGQDLRRAGKLHEARTLLALCVASSCPGAVREDCAQRLDELDRAMPSIVFEVKDNAGADLTAVRVAIDGKVLAERLGGTAIAVDPGEHRFMFEAEGMQALERAVVVREGEKARHEGVVLGALPGTRVGPAPIPATDVHGHGQRVAGLFVGGAGALGLVVGVVSGLVANSTYNGASQGCRAATGVCTSADQRDSETAHSQALVSTVSFVAGGVLLATGAVLYFTAPRVGVVAIAPTVGMSGAGLSLRSGW